MIGESSDNGMETILYFVRHAESVYVEGQERSRGLSEEGMEDALAVSVILKAEQIDCLISSPYERALATIRPAADELAKEIRIEEDLKERSIGDFSPLSFTQAKRRVYEDFLYKLIFREKSLLSVTRLWE